MPELPEVQTVVNDLNKKVLGRRITGVWFDTPKMIKNLKPERFKKEIKGLKIESVKRRGKNILIYLKDADKYGLKRINTDKKIRINQQNQYKSAYLLLIHQKMTGHLLIGQWQIKKVSSVKYQVSSLIKGALQEKVNDYIHLIFYLDNGTQLALSDLRKFAKVVFGPKEEIENLPEIKKLGPEPLDKNFTFNKFKERILYSDGRVRIAEARSASWRRVRRRAFRMQKIKQVLMDQKVIAGIGNIYADDTLWQARIHPQKLADKLGVQELKNIYAAMRKVLKMALKLRGTSISDFRDTSGKPGAYGNRRLVYHREGEPCSRCQSKIQRVKIGGRSSCFCPKCQKL